MVLPVLVDQQDIYQGTHTYRLKWRYVRYEIRQTSDSARKKVTKHRFPDESLDLDRGSMHLCSPLTSSDVRPCRDVVARSLGVIDVRTSWGCSGYERGSGK